MNIPETNTTSKSVSNPVKIPVTLTSHANDDVVATAVTYFCMTPSLTGEDWKTVLVPTGVNSPQEDHAEIELDSIEYEFQSIESDDDKQKALEPYQKAVLIIDLNPTSGNWQFTEQAIVYCNEPHNDEFNIDKIVSNDGKRLTLAIDKVITTEFIIQFQYEALFTEACGTKKVYLSQDPRVKIGRVIF